MELLTFTRALPTELFALRVHWEDDHIVARLESTRYPDVEEIHMDARISRSFLEALDNVGIERWPRANIDPFGPGGEVWTLTYRRPGEPDVLVEGDRAHPDNWEEFLRVVDLLVPQSTPERIDAITLVVTRDVMVSDGERQPVARPYAQRLHIARRAGTVAITRHENGVLTYTLTLRIKEAVQNFLDSCVLMFRQVPRVPPLEASNAPQFTLTVKRRGLAPDTWQGAYARNVLPSEWPMFMGRFREFMAFFANPGEMFDLAAYGHGVRPGELIYLSVEVGRAHRVLNYRTEDNSIRPGDRVLVPIGRDNRPVEGRVAQVGYFTPDDAPWPVAETKMVLKVLRETEEETGQG